MNTLSLPRTVWVKVGDGLTMLMIEARSLDVQVAIVGAGVTPAATTPGFTLPNRVTVTLPHLAELGGSVWVRMGNLAPSEVGKVTYATA